MAVLSGSLSWAAAELAHPDAQRLREYGRAGAEGKPYGRWVLTVDPALTDTPYGRDARRRWCASAG